MERMREEGVYGELARVQMIGETLAGWARMAEEENGKITVNFGPAVLEAMVDTIQEVYDNVVHELEGAGYATPSQREAAAMNEKAPETEPGQPDGQGLDG